MMKERHLITFISVLTLGNSALQQVLPSIKRCNIKFRIFHPCDSRKFQEFCIERGLDVFFSPYYNPSNCDTVFVAIPFHSNRSSSNVKPLIDVLASRCAFNIILLDNSATTDVTVFEYTTAVINAYQDALRFAKVLNLAVNLGLLSPRCITAIGYSLGAQLVGHMCRSVRNKCNQIYGLDPAGPLFFPTNTFPPKLLPAFQTVSKDDACRVTFLICNSGGLGTHFRPANEHIIVNGGIIQPHCKGLDTMLCSHDLCNLLMMDAILNPGACLARRKGCLEHPHTCKRDGIRNITIPSDNKCTSKDMNVAEHLYMTTSPKAECLGLEGARKLGGLAGLANEGLERLTNLTGSWFSTPPSSTWLSLIGKN